MPNHVDWIRWHKLLTIRDSPYMTWSPKDRREYRELLIAVQQIDLEFTRAVERYNYRLGKPLAYKARRRLGVCQWGHPDYIKGTSTDRAKQDWTGVNVATRKVKGKKAPYCAACHRAREARKGRGKPHGDA